MTLLIVSAAVLWQGSMASLMHFSAFSGNAASTPVPQGQPPGSYTPPQRGSDTSVPSNTIAQSGAGRLSSSGSQPVASEGSGAMGNASKNSSRII